MKPTPGYVCFYFSLVCGELCQIVMRAPAAEVGIGPWMGVGTGGAVGLCCGQGSGPRMGAGWGAFRMWTVPHGRTFTNLYMEIVQSRKGMVGCRRSGPVWNTHVIGR